jgi:3-isopropylmalate/(R)-2-methylmalate dehydratase small subunit
MQMPLFKPQTEWLPPEEFPDLTQACEIAIDLEKETIIFGNNEIKFEIDAFKKKCLLEGLDDIALSLEKSEKIVSFETELKNKKPWIFND